MRNSIKSVAVMSAGVLAASLLTGSGAVAASSAPGTIYACAKPAGYMRLVASTTTCKTGEKKTSWNQAGPQGPQGMAGNSGQDGAQGPKGDTGVTGLMGPRGYHGYKGDKGVKGDAGPKGDTGPQGPKGDTGPAGELPKVLVFKRGSKWETCTLEGSFYNCVKSTAPTPSPTPTPSVTPTPTPSVTSSVS